MQADRKIYAAKTNVDIFAHYDTDNLTSSDDAKMAITPNREGLFWVTLHNITIEFAQGYVPDTKTGFLLIGGMNNPNSGIVTHCAGTIKSAYIAFPIKDPTGTNPSCTIYNQIFLSPNDTFFIRYGNRTATPTPVARIVATVHIVDDYGKVYLR